MATLGPAARLVTTSVAVTTTGSAGSATGSATSGAINGHLLAVYLDYHASAPATTDVTITYGTPAWGTIVVKSNNATDIFLAPRKQAVDDAAAGIVGMFDLYPINGTVTVSVAQSDALTACVTAYLVYQTA